jgi:PPK2 family polyphosphate:nucleotide phosphotransferase
VSDTSIHEYRVPFDGSFRVRDAPTEPAAEALKKKKAKEELRELVEELDELQRVLYADNRHSVLLVFQAMDAAGKDGTIRAVTSGVNPAGFQVTSFKQPSATELEHDFLWRTTRALPERGRIGIFNRSYYEEVLVVRVHREILDSQALPPSLRGPDVWKHRFASIRDHERHLSRNGVLVLKFFLNVSRAEQKRRFVSRVDEPDKQWKFSNADVRERRFWDAYMEAYEDALNETSRPWAPWYAVPADDKSNMRVLVARIVVESLRELNLEYPRVTDERRAELQQMRRDLLGGDATA